MCSRLDTPQAPARADGSAKLEDGEAFALAKALGVRLPLQLTDRWPETMGIVELRGLGSPTVIVKAQLATGTHRSRSRAVAMVTADLPAVREVMVEMRDRLGEEVGGFTVAAFTAGDPCMGEVLLGAYRSRDFGPVLLLGPGGVHAELSAQDRRVGTFLQGSQIDGPEGLASLRQNPLMRSADEGHLLALRK
ncbi:MAG: acetate--CoA ligase family protein, partial [Planctomycetota bacterium]